MNVSRRRPLQLALIGPPALKLRGAGPTLEIAEFVVRTKYDDLPAELIELGKKSILDGLGLALVGSVAKSGAIVRQYIESLAASRGGSTVIGSSIKTSPRFAAFAN